MADRKIRLLRADEIECRVSTVGRNDASFLLYTIFYYIYQEKRNKNGH